MRVAPAALLKQRPSEEVRRLETIRRWEEHCAHGSEVWAFLAISTLYSVMLVTLLADYIRGAAG